MKQLFGGIVKTIFTGLLHNTYTETSTDSISSQVGKSFNNQLKTFRAIGMKKHVLYFQSKKVPFGEGFSFKESLTVVTFRLCNHIHV